LERQRLCVTHLDTCAQALELEQTPSRCHRGLGQIEADGACSRTREADEVRSQAHADFEHVEAPGAREVGEAEPLGLQRILRPCNLLEEAPRADRRLGELCGAGVGLPERLDGVLSRSRAHPGATVARGSTVGRTRYAARS